MIPLLPATSISAHSVQVDQGGALPVALRFEPAFAGLAGRVFDATYLPDDHIISFVARLRLMPGQGDIRPTDYLIETEGYTRGIPDFLGPRPPIGGHSPDEHPRMIGEGETLDCITLSVHAASQAVLDALRPDVVLIENRYWTIIIRMPEGLPSEFDLRVGIRKDEEDEADEQERETSSCDVCAPRERNKQIGDHGESHNPAVCQTTLKQYHLIAQRVARLEGKIIGVVETFQRIVHREGNLHLEKGFCNRESGHLLSVHSSWPPVPVDRIRHL